MERRAKERSERGENVRFWSHLLRFWQPPLTLPLRCSNTLSVNGDGGEAGTDCRVFETDFVVSASDCRASESVFLAGVFVLAVE